MESHIRPWQGTISPAVTVAPGTRPIAGEPHVPGSKYATVRAVLAAALAAGQSTIAGIPWTDDTMVLLGALRAVGVGIEQVGPEDLTIMGCGGNFPMQGPVSIDVGNAGAVLRFCMGALSLLPEVTFTTPYPTSLGRRPNGDLLDALAQIGVQVAAAGPDGTLPITLRRGAPHGGPISVSGARGSQYLSALLYLAPLVAAATGQSLEIHVRDELRSADFVRLTIAMLHEAGVEVTSDPAFRQFTVAGFYQPHQWQLSRDWPTMALWMAAGAMTGGAIQSPPLDAETVEGQALLAALAALGAPYARIASSPLPRYGPAGWGGTHPFLRGMELAGDTIIDSVPVLAALAAVATGTTTFHQVANLRLKESDRISDLCAEFHKVGVVAIPGEDTITIIGQPHGLTGGVTVDAHGDHRLAMALALLALRCRAPLTITGAQHVAKSYPAFWDELARLGAHVVPLTHP